MTRHVASSEKHRPGVIVGPIGGILITMVTTKLQSRVVKPLTFGLKHWLFQHTTHLLHKSLNIAVPNIIYETMTIKQVVVMTHFGPIATIMTAKCLKQRWF